MVATKSLKKQRRQWRKSPAKTKAASIISTINKSLSSCKRRIAKIFSKLVRISTPSRRSYKISKKHQKGTEFEPLVPKVLFVDKEIDIIEKFETIAILPPLISPEKRTIFLDLDETLIHSKPDPPPERFDFIVRPRIGGEIMTFYVCKRPGVDDFLEAMSKKYELVVFTAGLKEYASLVLDILDKNRVISHRLYRDSCKKFDGKYVKDLSELGRDLKKVVIVDDNPNAYSLQPENAVPVKPFVGDGSDIELLKLGKFFDRCRGGDIDFREAVKEFLVLRDFVDEIRYEKMEL